MTNGGNRNAIGAGGGRGIDHIYRFHHRAKQAGKGRGHNRVRIERRGLAVKFNADSGQTIAVHLPQKFAKFATKRHIGTQDRRFLGADRGHVEGICHRTIDQEIRHLFSHLEGDLFLRLKRAGAKMRRCHDIVHAEQQIGGCGFIGKHIKRRAGDMPG